MESAFSIQDNKVYYNDNVLKGISSDKFETILFTNEHKQTYVKYLKDKKGIWFFHSRKNGITKFLTADIDNFSIINDDYASDSKSVYLVAKDGFFIPNSDPDSFIILTNTPYFAKDKNQLYALDSSSGLSIYRYADNESIVSADGHQFVTDKHTLYHYSSAIEISNSQKYLNYLDPEFPYEKRKDKSALDVNKEFLNNYYPNIIGWWHKDYPFQIDIENIDELGFYKTKNAVFHLESNSHLKHNVPTLVRKADYHSFKSLNVYYGKDNKNVYYKSLLVLDADVNTFELVNEKLAKDKSSYFYNGNKIECDFDTFKVADENSLFFKDKNTLFSEQQVREGNVGMRYEIIDMLKPIKNSSPTTLKVFSSVWAKDDNQVYRYAEPFKKADVRTFEYLHIQSRYDWAKDENYLFSDSVKKIMKGIDGSSFIAFNEFWGKDENNVFFFHTEKKLPSIDINTFKITDDNGGAMDENYLYSVNEIGELKKKKI